MHGAASECQVRSFLERDIDLWLAEELRVNAGFAAWLVSRAAGPTDIDVPAVRTRVSVMGENGETDVEALFGPENRFALLVENKVEHSVSADQIARYRAPRSTHASQFLEGKPDVFRSALRLSSSSSGPQGRAAGAQMGAGISIGERAL